ncbi:hypothetical protein CBR_g82325, partial [Chara braunii]
MVRTSSVRIYRNGTVGSAARSTCGDPLASGAGLVRRPTGGSGPDAPPEPLTRGGNCFGNMNRLIKHWKGLILLVVFLICVSIISTSLLYDLFEGDDADGQSLDTWRFLFGKRRGGGGGGGGGWEEEGEEGGWGGEGGTWETESLFARMWSGRWGDGAGRGGGISRKKWKNKVKGFRDMQRAFADWDDAVGCKRFRERHLRNAVLCDSRAMQKPDRIACESMKKRHVVVRVRCGLIAIPMFVIMLIFDCSRRSINCSHRYDEDRVPLAG